MLGEDVSYDRIPYFFSDQYDVGMEYSGHAPSWDEVVFRGDREGGEFVAFWLEEGRVIAGMNVNVWDVNEQVQALIRSRREVDARPLRAPTSRSRSSRGRRRLGLWRTRIVAAAPVPGPWDECLPDSGKVFAARRTSCQLGEILVPLSPSHESGSI